MTTISHSLLTVLVRARAPARRNWLFWPWVPCERELADMRGSAGGRSGQRIAGHPMEAKRLLLVLLPLANVLNGVNGERMPFCRVSKTLTNDANTHRKSRDRPHDAIIVMSTRVCMRTASKTAAAAENGDATPKCKRQNRDPSNVVLYRLLLVGCKRACE